MELVFVGYSATACTRTLAFIGEKGIMPEKTVITKGPDNWELKLTWRTDQSTNVVEEVKITAADYGLTDIR